jgi:uncharacterized protein (TIGR01777 family)
MKVIIAGGSGALGRRLSAALSTRGHEVVVLSRTPRTSEYRTVQWDGETVGPWAKELAGSAVINLAGELVDCRPTPKNIALLTSSRVKPTRALAEAAASLDQPLPVWLQASTLAIYGDAHDELLTEQSPAADEPPQMTGVAKAWEAAATDLNAHRTTVLRTGIVFDRDTPALDRLAGLVRWGLGGRIASGRQWISWVHIDDWLRIAIQVVEGQGAAGQLGGVLHVTSPQPVRNAELMRTLRKVLHRPSSPPTPAWAVRSGAVLLRTDPALALTGRRAVPSRLEAAGFAFDHPELEEALNDLLHDRRSAAS